MSKEQFDKIVNKWISRKLLVFMIACGGLFTGFVPSGDWVVIAAGYIGIEGFTTIVEKLKNGTNR